MSRNGSGTYVLPTGNPVVTGTTITSNWANTTFSDVATALTGSVAADGQTPMTGPLAMGNNKITGVADGTASSDVATVNQISNPNITGGSIDGTPIGNISPSTGKFTTLNANAGATFTGTCTAPTVTPGSDSSTNIATTAFVQSAIAAVSSGVTSFNSRSGAVTLSSGDVTGALGYTPYNAAGTTVINTGNISSYAPGPTGSGASGNWGINITGNAATVTNGAYTNANNSFSGYNGFNATPNSSLTIYAKPIGANPAYASYTDTTSGASHALYISYSYSASPRIQTFSLGTPSSNTEIGSINVNSSSNGVIYATSSDRRLKTNIASLTTSGSFIDSLQPRTFNWVNNNIADTGFIADELQSVIPQAVIGTANAVDSNGKPIYQMIDSSSSEMIANMVAELKSLRSRVATLEAKG